MQASKNNTAVYHLSICHGLKILSKWRFVPKGPAPAFRNLRKSMSQGKLLLYSIMYFSDNTLSRIFFSRSPLYKMIMCYSLEIQFFGN